MPRKPEIQQRNTNRPRDDRGGQNQSNLPPQVSNQPAQREVNQVTSGPSSRSHVAAPVSTSWASVAAGTSRAPPPAPTRTTQPTNGPPSSGNSREALQRTAQAPLHQTNIRSPGLGPYPGGEPSHPGRHLAPRPQGTNDLETVRTQLSSVNHATSRGVPASPVSTLTTPATSHSSRDPIQTVGQASTTDRMPTSHATQSSLAGSITSPLSSISAVSGQTKAKVAEPTFSEELSLLVKRPSHCTDGDKLALYSNSYKLQATKSPLFRYSIKVMRETSTDDGSNASLRPIASPLRAQCIRLSLLEAKFARYKEGIITDHQSNLYSIAGLRSDLLETTIQYRTDPLSPADPRSKRYIVQLKQGNTLELSSIVSRIISSQSTMGQADRNDALTALNIFLGDFAASQPSRLTYLNNTCYNFGDKSTQKALRGGLKVITGFFSSVRPSSGSLLVNINPSCSAFYRSLRLHDLMCEWDQARSDCGEWHNPAKYDALQTFIKGLRIKACHLAEKQDGRTNLQPWIKRIWGLAQMSDGRANPQNNDKKRGSSSDQGEVPRPPVIEDIGRSPAVVKFWHKGKGRHVSVLDYFTEEYPSFSVKEKLSESWWCVVNVGTQERPTYLPAEACQVLDGQPYKKKLSPDQTKMIIDAAVLPPDEKKKTIERKGLAAVGLVARNNPKLNSFGLKLPDSSLLRVMAQKLRKPWVMEANGISPPQARPPTMWNMSGTKFKTAERLEYWTYVRLLDQKETAKAKDTQKIAAAFQERLKHHGMTVHSYQDPKLENHHVQFSRGPNARDTDFRNWLDHQTRQFKIHFLLIILPGDDADRYNRIKVLCDKTHGVKNVCALLKTVSNYDERKLSNLALKTNLKMLGVNFVVPAGSLGFIEKNETMVVGIDVTHPSVASAMGTPSVAAMVASTDSRLAQWPAELRIQRGRSRQGAGIEMTGLNLKGMLVRQLKRWTKAHDNRLPNNILVFRDGISETQYGQSLRDKLPQLRSACEQELKNGFTTLFGQPVRITFIVCAKRHNVRFYKAAGDKSNTFENPPGGTYVDRDVTEESPWDFYLQPHTPLRGTARPAHYIVLHDEVLKQEAETASDRSNLMAKITHSMCYLFGRSTGAVSICPAVYYAHLACARARCYMKDVYEGRVRGSPADLRSDEALERWQDGLQQYLELPDKVKDSMFYI